MDIFQILFVASPGPYSRKFFEFFIIFFFLRGGGGFFTKIFRFRKHGTLWKRKFQNATPQDYKSQQKLFQTLPDLFFQWSSQNYFLGFFKIEILTNFIRFR